MNFDLTDLRLFVHVAEAGSITAGAARAGLALASASSRVQGMEAQAGVALLSRRWRGIELTQAGEVLLRHARAVTSQVEHMRGDLGEYARGLRGRLRLAANTAAVVVHLPEPMAAFLGANPQVDVDLEERTSEEVVRATAQGESDLGIAADHADLSGLETRPFRNDRLAIVAPLEHPLANRRQIRFAEALGFEFIGLSGSIALGGHVAGHAIRAGKPMRIRMRVQSIDVACRMSAMGAGLAVVPEAVADRWEKQGALRTISLADAWAERRLMIVTRPLDQLPLHARRLAEFLGAQS
jgi:DNA-binding transcriptional LysR family regulator